MNEKPTVGSPFFGSFPSGRVPKAMNGVNVHLFTHSSNSCELYQRIPGTFCNYYVIPWLRVIVMWENNLWSLSTISLDFR